MAAGNTVNLPLVLVASLASDPPDLPLLLGMHAIISLSS
jgi:hypothetical protein